MSRREKAQGGPQFGTMLPFLVPMANRTDRAYRYAHDLLATLYIPGADTPEPSVIRDISETGVRIWLDTGGPLLIPGRKYELSIRRRAADISIRIPVIHAVMHSRPPRGGMEHGLKFVDPSVFTELDRLLSILAREEGGETVAPPHRRRALESAPPPQ